MENIRTYQIHINGQIIDCEIARFGPPGWTIETDERGFSILTVQTDQSGLIGLIRQLHGLGFELLSIESN